MRFLHCLSRAPSLFFLTSPAWFLSSLRPPCVSSLRYIPHAVSLLPLTTPVGPPPQDNELQALKQETCRLMEPGELNSLRCVFLRFSDGCATADTGIAIPSVLISLKVLRSLWSVSVTLSRCLLLTQTQSLSFELSCKDHGQKLMLPVFTEASSCFPSELCLNIHLLYL